MGPVALQSTAEFLPRDFLTVISAIILFFKDKIGVTDRFPSLGRFFADDLLLSGVARKPGNASVTIPT